MISFLSGTIIAKTKHSLTLLTTGGVGYEVTVTALQAAEHLVGKPLEIATYLKVSDSDLQLFGFATTDDREFFSLLLTVSGVGPKTAMNILALGSPKEIQAAIARGDLKYLTAVGGLGKKTAERLVVELKSKIQVEGGRHTAEEAGPMGEVIDVLVSMGYSKDEARVTVQALDGEGKTTEQLLREALQRIG